MKHIASILFAVTLIAVAYISQFGLPSFNVRADQQAAMQRAENGPKNQPATASNPPADVKKAAENGRPKPEQRIVTVTLAEVDFKPYELTYSAVGTAKAQTSVSVVSEVSGKIKAIHFEGTPEVEKGEILVELEDRTERLNLAIARSNLTKAEDSLERYQRLQKRNADAVTDVTMAEQEAAASVARSNLELAEESLLERSIISPIDGKLGLSDLQVGDYLANETTIFKINNTKTIVVTFELPERTIDILSIGKGIEASTPAKPGKIFKGKVTAFDNQIDETTRTVTVKAAINNGDGQLWPGMTFTVRLYEQSEPLASIPSMALSWTREGTHVWLAEGDKVRSVPVTFRHRRDDTIWVKGELQQGAKIVVDGVHKLRPGFSIAIAGSDSLSASISAHSEATQSGPSFLEVAK